ncbi:hypothetical protein WICPIJ_009004 [Wickerhamomyces pijperi]|uniref:DNA-directed RNA polymerase III subunit RPC4 n=1 Tax=Wickerhamomyces pijperi TaxID=599730 RepID=A0A9P8PTT8_WICPI|nr:hypothetical protein WICPIJ_009004 [Wickerhamomyces pijperi]
MSSNPQSDRLDSLTRGTTAKPGASKPGLKFKPKAVARRTKEDRDASAPTIETDTHNKGRGSHRGGRGGARGGRGGMRGGKNLAGTHVVQAGPLASGNAVGESSGQSKATGIRGITPDYLSGLGRKSAARSGATVSLDSEDEDTENFSKIDMSKEYKFDSQEVEMFPVRAPRAEYITEDGVKKEVSTANSRESSPEILEENINREDTPVKDEQAKDLQTLLEEKSATLQTKLESLNIATGALDDQFGVLEDEQRIKSDHKEIVEQLVDLNDKKDQFLFLQLPHILPEFNPTNSTDSEADVAALSASTTANVHVKPELVAGNAVPPQFKGLDGQIGQLRVHKSGKLTIKIGDVIMDVGKGSNTSFLQQVVLVDHQEKQANEDEMEDGKVKDMKLLGHIAGKIDVVPRFD